MWECGNEGTGEQSCVKVPASTVPTFPNSPIPSISSRLYFPHAVLCPRTRHFPLVPSGRGAGRPLVHPRPGRIGDFTRITSIAAAQDRVYATSPTSLVIWNPQFRQWDAPITPDDPTLLERVFTALIDPLDNSPVAGPGGMAGCISSLRSSCGIAA
jgi:hypothetical protein